MASVFTKVQQRILRTLTNKWIRLREAGIGHGELYRLEQMGLIDMRHSATCKNCGKSRGKCSCEPPVWPKAEDAFARLSARGVEEARRLRSLKARTEKVSFLDFEEADVWATENLTPGGHFVAYQLKDDQRWHVSAGKAPTDALPTKHHYKDERKKDETMDQTDEEKAISNAEMLARSDRGKWVIGRALCLLENKIETEGGTREALDLDDVKILLLLFPAFKNQQRAARAAALEATDGDESWLNL